MSFSLEDAEANQIEKLLIQNFQRDLNSEENISADIVQIKSITSEIKSINKQGALLIGERISIPLLV